MSSEEDKPPAPPVRLTSCSCNRGNERLLDDNQVDMKPLPKGMYRRIFINFFFLQIKIINFVIIYFSILEPDDERKKKTLKNKIKSKQSNESKPNISYPTNFEHTVHVGFDVQTGEFTVSIISYLISD